jgi:hypothetical protein
VNSHPIFVPSKGRASNVLTAKMFARDGVPFSLVVEPAQVDAYAAAGWGDKLLVLPENDRGLVFARNWIKDYSIAQGHERHWQFDDDVRRTRRLFRGRRVACNSGAALKACEEFVERYENVKLASLNSSFFIVSSRGVAYQHWPPFYVNSRCYTCFLMSNDLPLRWRGRYNEDADMTLQVIAAGWCTILFNAFLIETPRTMTDDGGQTSIYVGDGRLRMARELERRWPIVVETRRRYGRPQHVVKDSWRKFDTPLRLRPGVDLTSMPDVDEMGMKPVAID